jgi:hypothetical protein
MDASGTLTDSSGNQLEWIFHPGVHIPRNQRSRHLTRSGRSQQVITNIPRTPLPIHWAERSRTAPPPHTLRPLSDPSTAPNQMVAVYWNKDRTLTEWHQEFEKLATDMSANRLIFYPAGYVDQVRAVYNQMQRERWLARIVLQRWTQRVWLKRTQCNVDMIDMGPIANKDAILLTDTVHHQIFRFHRNDIFGNLLSKICMSDEMLPCPRPPTNPWTNAPLRFSQIVGLCHQLLADYAKRGICPPVLFSAFWAARFNLRAFHDQNSSLLSQHAITAYFKDIHEHNEDTIADTIFQLLADANLDYSPSAVRRWLRQRPLTQVHRDWIAISRDFTLFTNLHVQVRPHWYNTDGIVHDTRALFNRTPLSDAITNRIRMLRVAANTMIQPVQGEILMQPVPQPLSLFSLMRSWDASGNVMDAELALQLIQAALLR